MTLVASPDGLATAASSTTLFRYQSDPAAQGGVYTTHPTGGYFTHAPNHSQHLVRPEEQLASGLQEEEPYPDLNADHPNPSPNVCWCGAAFGRRADLERHQRTTRKHNGDYRSVSTAILYSQITCINAPELELYYHYKS